jgi:hypothetical protein
VAAALLIVMLAVVAAVVLAGCRTPPPGRFRRALLLGVVTDGAGRPVGGAVVHLDEKRTETTAASGRFAFARVRRGSHDISVDAKGYEPAVITVEFTDRRQMAYVRLISRAALIADAAAALERGDLAGAETLLTRAQVLGQPETDSDVAFLRSILALKRRAFSEAVDHLAPLADSSPVPDAVARLEARIGAEWRKALYGERSTRSGSETR